MKKKQRSYGIVLSYISIAQKLLVGILYTPVILKRLGSTQYGIYSLCISLVGYLTILNAGVNAAYVRFYVQAKTVDTDRVGALNGLFKKVFLALSLIGTAGGLLCAYFSPLLFGTKITPEEYDLVRQCLVLLSITIGVEVYSCLYKSFINANEEFIFGRVVDIAATLLNPVLTVPLLMSGASCSSIIAVRLAVSTISLLCEVIFSRLRLKIVFQHARVNARLKKNIVQFVCFVALQSIMDQLNWQIDKLILARTQGPGEISVYTVGATFNSHYITIASAISAVFIAEINRYVASKNFQKLNDLFRRTSRLLTMVVVFVMMSYFVFGRHFVIRWAGEEYQKAYTVGWMLMLPVTFALMMGLGQDIARARNKHQLQIVINVLICIVNAIISIPLSVRWGAIGSAAGTLMAETIMCIVIQPIYYHHALGLQVTGVISDFIHFIPSLALPVLFGVIINYTGLLKNSYTSIFSLALPFGLLYISSIWLLSLKSEDKVMINRFLVSIKEKLFGSGRAGKS